jgi:hypothetical protein
MATIPLNSFKTTTYNLTNVNEIIYVAPAGVTTVVLLAQVANNDPANTVYASASLVRNSNTTTIIKNTAIPINDAVSLLSGKLIIQSGDSLYAKSSANGNSQLILSYLETANQ